MLRERDEIDLNILRGYMLLQFVSNKGHIVVGSPDSSVLRVLNVTCYFDFVL